MDFPRNNATDLFRNRIAGEPIIRDNGKYLAMIEAHAKTPPTVVDINSDTDFRKLVAHVLRTPEEHLGAFVARSGLGKAQASQMTAKEITDFVRQAEVNAMDDPCALSQLWEPKAAPAHFVLD